MTFWSKNVTSLTRGAERPFRCLDFRLPDFNISIDLEPSILVWPYRIGFYHNFRSLTIQMTCQRTTWVKMAIAEKPLLACSEQGQLKSIVLVIEVNQACFYFQFSACLCPYKGLLGRFSSILLRKSDLGGSGFATTCLATSLPSNNFCSDGCFPTIGVCHCYFAHGKPNLIPEIWFPQETLFLGEGGRVYMCFA